MRLAYQVAPTAAFRSRKRPNTRATVTLFNNRLLWPIESEYIKTVHLIGCFRDDANNSLYRIMSHRIIITELVNLLRRHLMRFCAHKRVKKEPNLMGFSQPLN